MALERSDAPTPTNDTPGNQRRRSFTLGPSPFDVFAIGSVILMIALAVVSAFVAAIR